MKMEEAYACKNYKILKVEVEGGGKMPEHFATSDAFVVVLEGEAVVNFVDGEHVTIKEDMTYLIPEKRQHNLTVVKDFKAVIVLGGEARIEYARK